MTLLKWTVRSVFRMLTHVKQSTGNVVMLFMSSRPAVYTRRRHVEEAGARGGGGVTHPASQRRGLYAGEELISRQLSLA